ncbi:MAG TPA: metal ABC transporter ATP-binding protein [Anaerolineae bacterium]|nr:metal ABC transporter ATP-binding protein [Anaerolineae bacterium]
MSNQLNGQLCLRIGHLDIGYDRGPVIADINVELCAGQSLALVGINGSGKSTLLKTIVGLQPSLAGEIDVFGTRPGTAPKHIAYLSQFHASGFVLPLRAVDVVRMGRFPARGLLGRMTHEDDDLVRAAMQTMGIERLADAPLRSLSGGQQQRVYLAQVLARRGDLLVLDEPTSGLDARGREIYGEAMQSELARGATLITATHDIQEAARCDCVMLLAQRVIACGAPEEVLTPERLLETFGIVLTLRDQHLSLAVVDREHGHDHAEHHS